MPGSSMGIVESYSGACGGARSCLAIYEARMWLLGKSCVSCLAGGQRTRFLAGILFGNIFRSLEQHCGVRAAPRSRFLANLVESAKHSCRAPRSPAIRRSVRERLATARTRAEETEGEADPQRAGLYCCLEQAQKKRQESIDFCIADRLRCVTGPPESAVQALHAHARRGGTRTAKTTLQPPQPCKKRCVPTAEGP